MMGSNDRDYDVDDADDDDVHDLGLDSKNIHDMLLSAQYVIVFVQNLDKLNDKL